MGEAIFPLPFSSFTFVATLGLLLAWFIRRQTKLLVLLLILTDLLIRVHSLILLIDLFVLHSLLPALLLLSFLLTALFLSGKTLPSFQLSRLPSTRLLGLKLFSQPQL